MGSKRKSGSFGFQATRGPGRPSRNVGGDAPPLSGGSPCPRGRPESQNTGFPSLGNWVLARNGRTAQVQRPNACGRLAAPRAGEKTARATCFPPGRPREISVPAGPVGSPEIYRPLLGEDSERHRGARPGRPGLTEISRGLPGRSRRFLASPCRSDRNDFRCVTLFCF